MEAHTSVDVMVNAPELRAFLESFLPLVISKATTENASHNLGNVWHGILIMMSIQASYIGHPCSDCRLRIVWRRTPMWMWWSMFQS